MHKSLIRRLWIFVGLALVLTAVLVFVGGREAVARVDVVSIGRQDLSTTISTNGKVEPVAPQMVRAGFDAVVEKIDAVEGQQVKKGQLLFTMEDTVPRGGLAQARSDLQAYQEALRVARSGGSVQQLSSINADLKKTQARLAQLRRDNDSLTKLVSQKAATQYELEQNRLALSQTEADLQSLTQIKQATAQTAETDIEHLTLLIENTQARIRDYEEQVNSARAVSAVDGTLYGVTVLHVGDFVTKGELLAAVADLRQIRVRAYIDEPELGLIAVNQPVEILSDTRPGRVWNGRTQLLPKEIVAHGARNVGELLCSAPNERLDLLPNTTVDVHIHVSEHPNVLAVPRGAVYADGSKRYVYVAEGNRLHRRWITVGIANPTMFEVLSGLQVGEVVALPGDTPLRENLRIRAILPG